MATKKSNKEVSSKQPSRKPDTQTVGAEDAVVLAAQYLRHPWRNSMRHVAASIVSGMPLISKRLKKKLKKSSKKRDGAWLSKNLLEATSSDVSVLPLHKACKRLQDAMFPKSVEDADKILVVLIPEHNAMSGGIYSFFSILSAAQSLRHLHGYECILMTRPNKRDETYFRQKNFRSSNEVFRFEQIEKCQNAREIYLHIPEYATTDFVDNLDIETLDYLRSREKFYVNILNQKIDIMPSPEEFSELRSICDELTQSVAHHAYFGQSFADKYDTPLLLLPAYTDLSGYPPIPHEEKRKLIIYSPDEAPWKEGLLQKLERDLPDYEFREIRDITFDTFMDLATQCRYSITFGEGFDGYLAQPIYQGGVGFAVYNEEFFPSKELKDFDNIFLTPEDILARLTECIRKMDDDPKLYCQANSEMMSVYDDLYSREDYLKRVEMLINREFELRPLHISGMVDSVRI